MASSNDLLTVPISEYPTGAQQQEPVQQPVEKRPRQDDTPWTRPWTPGKFDWRLSQSSIVLEWHIEDYAELDDQNRGAKNMALLSSQFETIPLR
jgi:hypothetical protein